MTLSEAVRIFKQTQPQIDNIAETTRLNKRARDVLKDHFREQGITEYRGIVMTEQMVEGWDNDALRAELGERAAKFRRLAGRCHFRLAGRQAKKTA